MDRTNLSLYPKKETYLCHIHEIRRHHPIIYGIIAARSSIPLIFNCRHWMFIYGSHRLRVDGLFFHRVLPVDVGKTFVFLLVDFILGGDGAHVIYGWISFFRQDV